MKKLAFFLLLPLFWQCTTGPSRTELQQMNDSLLMSTAQKEIQMNQLIETISDIEENIRLIKEKEQIIAMQAESGDTRGRAGQQINDDIQLIYELMVQNKERIQTLENDLKKSGADSQRLNRLIAGLNEQLRERSEQIMKLQEQLEQRDLAIGMLSNEIAGLSTQMDSIRRVNEATRNQLDSTTDLYNTAWYAIGTRRELRDQKILTRDGFLFFGSTKILKDGFDKQYFNQVDIRQTPHINFYNSKAEILTSHPAESYEIINDEEGNKVLMILEPRLFWSVSKYLVAQVN
jgi:hypothetical protein